MRGIAAALAVGLALGSIGTLAAAPGDTTIRGCVGLGGVLRVAERCLRGETRLEWSQRGPQGIPGPSGAPGASGVPGEDGEPGADGAEFAGEAQTIYRPEPVELSDTQTDVFATVWGHDKGKWLITFKATLENTSDEARTVLCVLDGDAGEHDQTRETLGPGEVETVFLLITMHVAFHLNGKIENSAANCLADGPGVIGSDRVDTTVLVGVVPFPDGY